MHMNDYVQRLRSLDCCAVSDALDRLGLSGVISGVPQRSGNGLIAGNIITLKLDTKKVDDNQTVNQQRHLGTMAVETGGPDNVIVIEQSTGIEAGSWGGLLTIGAKVRGINGVISDGPVRDIDEARYHQFPIFSSSLTALTARGRIVEAGTNIPIVAWGHVILPGDYVIADSSSIIFIKQDNIKNVIETAETIFAKEAAMANKILRGEPISKVLDGKYENMLND